MQNKEDNSSNNNSKLTKNGTGNTIQNKIHIAIDPMYSCSKLLNSFGVNMVLNTSLVAQAQMSITYLV